MWLMHLCSSWQDFNWQCASRGASAIAELLVADLMHAHWLTHSISRDSKRIAWCACLLIIAYGGPHFPYPRTGYIPRWFTYSHITRTRVQPTAIMFATWKSPWHKKRRPDHCRPLPNDVSQALGLRSTRQIIIIIIITTKRGKAQRVAHPACANATVHFLRIYRLAMLLPPSE